MQIENLGVVTTPPDSYAGAGAPSVLINRQILTGAGIYIATPGTKSVVVEGQAGGASGGGADAVAGQTAIAQSGTGGAYFSVRLTDNFDGAAFVVGSGGLAPAVGNNIGNAGGNTTFTTTGGAPVVYSATGGNPGPAGVSAAATSFHGPNTGPAAPANGDIKIGGGSTEASFRNGATQGFTPCGGDSVLGKGGRGASTFGGNTSMGGAAGTGFGSGGSGGVCEGTGAAVAGGAGAPGTIIVWEYR
jgi:hypothetical protein